MIQQDDKAFSSDEVTCVKEYAELLKESKKNTILYQLISVAMASYADGVKNTLRCTQTAEAV